MSAAKLFVSVLITGCTAGGGDGPWYSDESERVYIESLVLAAIIVVAIIFETIHHLLHETIGGDHSQKPDEVRKRAVMNALAHSETINYKLKLLHRTSDEFMVLGFIACLVWLVNRCNGFQEVLIATNTSRFDYLGPTTASELLHVVEDVHMCLFASMALYFASLFMTFRVVSDKVLQWRDCERRYKLLHRPKNSEGQTDRQEQEETQRSRSSMFGCLKEHPAQTLRRYSIMREHFVEYMLSSSTENHARFAGQKHLHFDFACYLEVMVDDLMHEFIFVHKATWMCLGSFYVALGIAAGYMELGEQITIMMLSVVGAANLFALFVMFYVYQLYNPRKDRKSVKSGGKLCCNSEFLQQKLELLATRLMQALLMFTSYTMVSFVFRSQMWIGVSAMGGVCWAVLVCIAIIQGFAFPHLIPALNILVRLPPFVDAAEIKVVKIILDNCEHDGDQLNNSISTIHAAVRIDRLAHEFHAARTTLPQQEMDGNLTHNKIVV